MSKSDQITKFYYYLARDNNKYLSNCCIACEITIRKGNYSRTKSRVVEFFLEKNKREIII